MEGDKLRSGGDEAEDGCGFTFVDDRIGGEILDDELRDVDGDAGGGLSDCTELEEAGEAGERHLTEEDLSHEGKKGS